MEQAVPTPRKPLLSRADEELFPPGSTFKLVTASAALENGMTPDTDVPEPGPRWTCPRPRTMLHNFGGEHCLGGAPQLTLAQALRSSCNVVFGEIGLRLGGDESVAQAERFGFDQRRPVPDPFRRGEHPTGLRLARDALPAVAFSAIGQQSVGANPLQMALVAPAIANGGVEMPPQLVQEIRDPAGRVVKTPRPAGVRAADLGHGPRPS